MQLTNTTKPLVSIIVITYNHEPYIGECLQSLINQKRSFPIEILVGDDCSLDKTRDKVLFFSEKYPDVIKPILYEVNQRSIGKSNLQNLLKLATGKYIAICEGDDYWHRTDKLQRQIDIMESDPEVSLVCTDADAYIQTTGKRIRSIHERNGQWVVPHKDITVSLLTRKINIFTCTACIPRELMSKVYDSDSLKMTKGRGMTDIQIWFEISKLGKIVPIRESMATYRVLTESASRSKSPEKLFNFYENSLWVCEFYVKHFNYDDNVLDLVRRSQIRGMFHMAIESQSNELRLKLLKYIQEWNFIPKGIMDWICIWALKSRKRSLHFKSVNPIYLMMGKVHYKISCLRRLTIKLVKY